ncbi:probable transcription factor MYB58 [Phragmites australis]|uniref:probable transcription factor MYB58 n=1 Tax=Phragmites australis TaxID=29695 RepID=UPI002D782F11|nr:probable transcription factor MYB58 [Phragmites australis]
MSREAMAGAPGGARRRGGSRRDAANGDAARKGAWMAEEDEVLLEHVRTHGPREWSSIPSKGLLPRSGKSCRLRWVNKLRPNLKTGCKFSAEEERVVLELQAQFGNRWARIATYLPGRTDNDVKNFWSARQKRLARLLRTPVPGGSGKNSRAKAPAASSMESPPAVGPCPDQVPYEGGSSSGHQCLAATPFIDAQNAALVLHDQTGSGLLGFKGTLAPVAPATDSHACSSNAAPLPPELPFDQPPYPLLDFPGMPESWDMAPGFVNAGGMYNLAYQELLPVMQPGPKMLPFFGMEFQQDGVKAEPPDAPDDFFDDLPPDLFSSLDQLPPPLLPPATKSEF